MATRRSGSTGKWLLGTVLFALFALLGACGGSTTETDGSGGSAGSGGAGGVTCEFNGKTYKAGESFSLDCNTCSCGSDGLVACTAMWCGPAECLYDGKTYQAGDKFPATDGCNTCECSDSGAVGCTELACTGCVHEGKPYPVGASFPAGDGCNSCTCQSDGFVACTLLYCEKTCTYAGKTYKVGESFPALDGCNTCTCTEQGVGCTKIGCMCDPNKEWWRDYVATSPAQCAAVKYTCPEHTTPFSNSCGCGCEQSSACPEWFNCMPPSPCDADMLKKCPYSGVAY